MQDILNKTKTHQTLEWFKTLKQYYNRPEWELYDIRSDPEELNNIATKKSSTKIFEQLKRELFNWQNKTDDPWLCSPHGVFEDKGIFKNSPQCLDLYN